MTGKQVAANLRGSDKRWGTGLLYSSHNDTYCVVGLKCMEAGISPSEMDGLNGGTLAADYIGVVLLMRINDNASSKENLISRLENVYSHVEFDIEGYIAAYQKRAK